MAEPDFDEEEEKEKAKKTKEQIQASLKDKIETSGEREYLRELLIKRLREHGWDEEMQDFCKASLNNKGLSSFNMESFVNEIALESRAAVPDPVRSEIYGRIKRFLALGGMRDNPE